MALATPLTDGPELEKKLLEYEDGKDTDYHKNKGISALKAKMSSATPFALDGGQHF
ncbi:MAG TPA: hypothetical protein VFA15_07165 [Nitrososphaera sp.]|nr:hypothetical protein [Nitrososphaera sp.]